MGKWLVTVTEVINYEVEVEADSYDEAMNEGRKVVDYNWDELCQVENEVTVDDAEEIE